MHVTYDIYKIKEIGSHADLTTKNLFSFSYSLHMSKIDPLKVSAGY